ncbi:hypothetical protein Godav_022948 [Gossypium davidsonii]|uniref:Uncharacterized protein n=2 Tax=Gossypium TaxID=3633 RepID=A0A7J8SQ31_GOSDV|nr:hypothetical protein [Gossypium davidsonii]
MAADGNEGPPSVEIRRAKEGHQRRSFDCSDISEGDIDKPVANDPFEVALNERKSNPLRQKSLAGNTDRRLAIEKTGMEVLISTLNQEVAVRQFLTAKVKDLEDDMAHVGSAKLLDMKKRLQSADIEIYAETVKVFSLRQEEKRKGEYIQLNQKKKKKTAERETDCSNDNVHIKIFRNPFPLKEPEDEAVLERIVQIHYPSGMLLSLFVFSTSLLKACVGDAFVACFQSRQQFLLWVPWSIIVFALTLYGLKFFQPRVTDGLGIPMDERMFFVIQS